MGVTEEQQGLTGMPEELKNIKVTIRSLITCIKILITLIAVGMAGSFAMCVIGLIGYIGEPSPETADKLGEGIMLFFSAGAAIAIAIICKNIFKEIDKSNTPFIPQVPRGMRRIAAVICVMFVFQALAVLLYPMLIGSDPVLYFNWTGFIFISVLMLLSYIFDYGCKLQKESDETL